MAKITFEKIDDSHYKVVGKSYIITYEGCGDADPDYVSLWSCSCPGYKYRGNCKHMDEFLNKYDRKCD